MNSWLRDLLGAVRVAPAGRRIYLLEPEPPQVNERKRKANRKHYLRRKIGAIHAKST